jgi:dTDP-4-amino-4,6-dideoxygalactose transaminase
VPEAVAFSAVLVLASRAQRDAVRSALITGRIYPAILWALDEPARPLDHPEAKDLAERVLSVHVDHRYDADDMTRIASVVLHALEAS